MILSVMREIKNFFEVSKETGTFTIQDEVLTGFKNTYPIGSYIAITGSIMSNNVYLVNDNLMTLTGAKNEVFNGVIYQLAPPKDFLELVKQIEEFNDSETGTPSNVASSSFGIENISFVTDKDGIVAGWQSVFGRQLHKYRKMFLNIDI